MASNVFPTPNFIDLTEYNARLKIFESQVIVAKVIDEINKLVTVCCEKEEVIFKTSSKNECDYEKDLRCKMCGLTNIIQ